MPNALHAEFQREVAELSPPSQAAWISTLLGREGLIQASVIFPAQPAALTPRPLGCFRSVALLRLVSGPVWLLSTLARTWTDARLDAAARLLADKAVNPESWVSVERRLRTGLNIPELKATLPCLDAIDAQQWGLLGTVRSAVARADTLGAGRRPRGDGKARIIATRSLLYQMLNEALAAFVAQLDSEALAAASASGRIDLLKYNFLAYRPYRRFRLQFAVAFPNLVEAAAQADSGTVGADVRSSVDAGRPLVQSLAQTWGVRPGVIRELMRAKPETLAAHWTGDLPTLARLLDALRPGDLPGDDPLRWQDLSAAIAVGRKLFHDPVQHSPAAQRWLRDCVGQLRRGSPAVSARWLPDGDAAKRIAHFRAIVRATLRRDSGATTIDAEHALIGFLETRLDQLFADLAPRGLAQVSDAFREERARVVPDAIAPEDARRIKSRQMLLPLLPRDFVAADGRRVLRPLTTDAELQRHGEALEICLASSTQRFNYRFVCQRGGRFLVGVFDAVTRAPVSTADILVKHIAGFGAYSLVVKQHTGHGNTQPSPACRRAVSELLEHCRTLEVRRHLLEGWHLLHFGSTGWARFELPVDMLWHAADREALRATLGAERYDGLVAESVRARRCGASSC